MKKANVLLLLLFFTSQIFAQTFYQKTITPASQPYGYGINQAPYMAKKTFDKGIIFTCFYYKGGSSPGYHTGLLKLNSNNAVEWSIRFSMDITSGNTDFYPFDLIQTRDSGYVVSGVFTHNLSTDAAYIVKFNKKGKLLWEKYFQGANFTWGCSLAEDRAGNIFISGKTDVGAPTNASDIWVIKLNRAGTIQLNKTYHIAGNNAYINKIVSSKDNGFAVIATAGGNTILMKADTLGTPVFTKVFGEQLNPYKDYKMDIVESGNRDLTVLATRFDGSVISMQLTKEGNLKWSKVITAGSALQSNDLLQLSSGNFIASAVVTGTPNKIAVFKLDNATGNLIVSKNFKSTEGKIFNSINTLSSTEFSLTGWDASNTTNYISLVNFDSSLQNCIDEVAGITIADFIPATEDGITSETTVVGELALNIIGFPWANATTVAAVCENVLPLNLIRFTLSKNGSSNILSWSTSEEINTSYFEVQRSINNTSFAAIGKVLAGKNTVQNSYQFTDAHPLNGTNFYRLKITDVDGKFTYSPILQSSNTKVLDIAIYPNPVKDRIVLNINSKTKTSFNISVTDMQGRILLTTVLNVDEGVSKREINASALKQGTYFVRMESAEGSQIIKIIK